MADEFLLSDWSLPLPPALHPDDPQAWLHETAQLDTSEPRLRITAQKLTQSVQTIAGRAAALQGYVRKMPFTALADARSCTASEVLRRRRGDAACKGLLFAALCRAAGIPARLQFFEVRARFLSGLVQGPAPVTLHAVAQVHVDGRWLSTDGYVVDPIVFAHAKRLLREHDADAGWGVRAAAKGVWDGKGDCLQQLDPADVIRPHPPVHEPAGFNVPHRRQRAGWSLPLAGLLHGHLLERRVRALRAARA
jgi:transglutaminase-like putative cysteine protease